MAGQKGPGWPTAVFVIGELVLMASVGVLLGAWNAKDLGVAANLGQIIGVVLAVPALAIGLWAWWRAAGRAVVTDAQTVAAAKEALAVMVAAQWREEARLRDLDDPDPMPVRWELAADQGIMDHPAHIASAGASLTWSGSSDQIAAIVGQFRALRRRRLVILGGPGSGKTTLAVQIVRELLTNPEPGEPVPVLVSIAGWDTEQFPRLQGWLAARLSEIYPSLNAREYGPDAADQLVQRAHILPVLDGLDELPATAQMGVIAALNRSLSDTDQLILTSRTREFTDAATAGDVLTSAAVIQPCPLTAEQAGNYLASCLPPTPPDAWADTLHRLRTGDSAHLADVIATPLGLWLLRITYVTTRTDPTSLTDPAAFPSRAALQAHLFDRLIPALIDTRPPSSDPADLFRPRCHHDPDEVTRWLAYVAELLDKIPTRDFAWWRLASTTLTRSRIRVTAGLAAALGCWLVVGLGAGLMAGLRSGISDGFVTVLPFAVLIGLKADDWTRETPGYANLQMAGRRSLLVRRLAEMLAFGLVLGFVAGLAAPVKAGRLAGLTVGLVAGLVMAIVFGLPVALASWAESPASSGRSSTPVTTWRADRNLNVLRGLVTGIAFSLVTVPLLGVLNGVQGLVAGSALGLAAGLSFGLIVGRRRAWPAYLMGIFWLARWRKLPWRLMAFLDDAHRLGLLRTVGPIYQFRHAEFQDHLARRYRASAAVG